MALIRVLVKYLQAGLGSCLPLSFWPTSFDAPAPLPTVSSAPQTHTHTHTHTNTHTHTRTQAHTHTCTYIHRHTHTCTYIHRHTHTQRDHDDNVTVYTQLIHKRHKKKQADFSGSHQMILCDSLDKNQAAASPPCDWTS